MKPVKHAGSNVCYKGPSAEIGDLWCQRQWPGLIEVIYELDDDDRALIAEGGKIRLSIYNEPIPPVAISVAPAVMYRPVAEHLYKEIPELRERKEPS